MAQAREGDKVKVNYTGRLADGEVFDSTECAEDGCDCDSGPMEFTIGEGEVIPGFEQAVVGMAPGERKTVIIPVDQAYGERIEEMVAEVERSQLPPDLHVELGSSLELTMDDGQTFDVLVTELNDATVTIDGNHPLAGRDLTFDIELLEIC